MGLFDGIFGPKLSDKGNAVGWYFAKRPKIVRIFVYEPEEIVEYTRVYDEDHLYFIWGGMENWSYADVSALNYADRVRKEGFTSRKEGKAFPVHRIYEVRVENYEGDNSG